MAKKTKKQVKQIRKVPVDCPFDRSQTQPSYKDYQDLAKFLNDRSKIQGKDRTGVCSKHQRALGREIKRARHLGLLPFAPGF
ncbi:30S ribosomal protein S18 [Candidatus Woesebacteria bacterium]|nr:MAG: 30S ribosomal protein S18 [Candidatus Woesebacteria bacterium]